MNIYFDIQARTSHGPKVAPIPGLWHRWFTLLHEHSCEKPSTLIVTVKSGVPKEQLNINLPYYSSGTNNLGLETTSVGNRNDQSDSSKNISCCGFSFSFSCPPAALSIFIRCLSTQAFLEELKTSTPESKYLQQGILIILHDLRCMFLSFSSRK